MSTPTGTVAFLFTDIEGSTRAWEDNPESMARRVADHDRIISDSVTRHGGVVFSTAGDSFAAAFHTPTDAIEAAVEAQLGLRGLVAVRMAVHVGQVESRGGDYFGPTLNRAGRLRDAAHGGQIVCSQAVADTLGTSDTFGFLDLGEHRLRDLGRPEHIHQISHPDLPGDFPPLNTLRVETTNLPIQVTSFVGRHQEMAELDKLLHASRLVTLVGAGGCGKSRLAIETAAELVDEFPDGVWLVELGSLDHPDLVPQTIATLFGVRERPDATLTDALVTYLKRRRLLLVLDNCEHLLDSVTSLVHAVITGTTDVSVLATSREPLHTPGETIYPVPPLPLPDPDADTATVAHTDAVRLFVERAAAVSPNFHLTADTAPTIASICRHLDGIPLAIELAAATTRLLPLPDIESRLDDRFRLLRGASRDPLPHHRTLEAAIDWSYDHLIPEQQTLFTRLAVFEGGWTVEAAETVSSGDSLAEGDVLRLLVDLVDRSLVVPVETDGEARFRYLETVWSYARARLGNDSELRRRHSDYFQVRAEFLGSRMNTPDGAKAMNGFVADLDNFRSTLVFLAESNHGTEFCRLLLSIRMFLWVRRMNEEAERLFEQALRLLPANSDLGLEGELLLATGVNMLRGRSLRKPEALPLIRQSADLLARAHNDITLSESLTYLAVYDDLAFGAQALAVGERSGNPTAAARPLHFLGIMAFWRGDHDIALKHLRQAADLFPGPHEKSLSLAWLAKVLFRTGQTSQALAAATEAEHLSRLLDDPGGMGTAIESLVAVRLHHRDGAKASQAMRFLLECDERNMGEIDRGTFALAAHAASLLGDDMRALEHLTSARNAQGTGLLNIDSQTHAFMAVTLLALGRDDPHTATLSLAAERSHRAMPAVSTSRRVMPNTPREQDLDDLERQARSFLPPDQFDSAWLHGTTLTLDDIIDLALDKYGE